MTRAERDAELAGLHRARDDANRAETMRWAELSDVDLAAVVENVMERALGDSSSCEGEFAVGGDHEAYRLEQQETEFALREVVRRLRVQ